MKQYNEIISASLIDFEEIKLVLANNNIELISSSEIKERYFLSKDVSFKNANYRKIIEKNYVVVRIDDKLYLSHRSKLGYQKTVSNIEVINENDCIDFLNHIGFEEAFEIEMNVYEYGDSYKRLRVINLIGIGLFLSVRKEDASEEELKNILSSFKIPYNEDDCDVGFERLAISKARRYMK